mmetsp:Transcript_4493/g.10773  ORF Transcript_4493/g.10773 Transcript_4493/m.10773 type:complete len:245 (-) Transcript_4493:102-836(-)
MGGISTVRRSLKVGKPEEGLLQFVLLSKVENGTVKTNENRNLDDTGDAAGEGVHLIGLVHLGNLLVHDLRIRLILGLNVLDGRLQSLHLAGTLKLRLGKGIRQALDDNRHGHNTDAPSIGRHANSDQSLVNGLQEELDGTSEETKPSIVRTSGGGGVGGTGNVIDRSGRDGIDKTSIGNKEGRDGILQGRDLVGHVRKRKGRGVDGHRAGSRRRRRRVRPGEARRRGKGHRCTGRCHEGQGEGR